MSPTHLAEALAAPGTVLLDSAQTDADTGDAGALLFSDPAETITAARLGDVGPCLDALDARLGRGAHVAGLLSYEAGAALVPGLSPTEPPTDVPLVWLGVYDAPQRVSAAEITEALGQPDVAVSDLTVALSRDAYREQIGRARAHIRAGDVYQVNLTFPLHFRTRAPAVALYAALRARQAVPYGALLNLPGASVISVSPELFVRIDADASGEARTITARPMKGTAPRGATPAEDDRLTEALLSREKDRAENLMIVDLLRNDLSRVAERGSVRVPRLFAAERYETVTQMTSTVTAQLPPDARVGDVLRATFPCGSVTGAPKRRAVEVLRTLEGGPRGAYCGAVGYAAPDGSAVFNVAIRTATLTPGGRGTYAVGSGVVWDSQADAEYDECLLKARVLSDLAEAPIRVPE